MRAMDAGELLDTTIRAGAARWPQLALAVLVVMAPVEFVGYLGNAALDDGLGAPQIFIWIVQALVGTIGWIVAIGAGYRIVVAGQLGHEIGWQESLSYVARRLGDMVVLAVLTGLVVTGGLIVFLIPGVWIAVALSVAMPVLLAEGAGATASMSRSFELVQDRWWATFGRLIAGGLLIGLVSVLVSLAAAALASVAFGDLAASYVGAFVASVVTYPFAATLTVLVYLDLRIRKEGLDPGTLGFVVATAGGNEEVRSELPSGLRPDPGSSVAPADGGPDPSGRQDHGPHGKPVREVEVAARRTPFDVARPADLVREADPPEPGPAPVSGPIDPVAPERPVEPAPARGAFSPGPDPPRPPGSGSPLWAVRRPEEVDPSVTEDGGWEPPRAPGREE